MFFLFYFNRLFATLVSYGIRSFTWHRYRAYIDIQALQISLLGGRIFFKNIRYHGHNQTILIHSGYITWKYWLRKVKDPEVFRGRESVKRSTSESDSSPTAEGNAGSGVEREEQGGVKGAKDLPCRISIKLSGVEAFLYNRSPGYDAVIENITRVQRAKEGKSYEAPMDPEIEKVDQRDHQDQASSGGASDRPRKLKRNNTYNTQPERPPLPSYLGIFPIRVDCRKAAAVVGNENTKAVLVAKVDNANGEFDVASSGPMDFYKQLFRFEFIHPTVTMRPNVDFKSTQLAAAARLKQEAREGIEVSEKAKKKSTRTRLKKKVWHPIRALANMLRRSTSSSILTASSGSGNDQQSPNTQYDFPGQERWQGLSRYLDESQFNEHEEWDAIEYAKSSLLVDSPKISMTYYWDIPGVVPSKPDDFIEPTTTDDINGTLPPDYGLDLHIYGGTINYGPWADRLRTNFQSIFFPGAYCDAEVAKPLQPGDSRVNTIFKIYLCIEEDTTLRIPIREPSKDWKWKGKAQTLNGQGKDVKEKIPGKGRRRTVWRKRDKGPATMSVRPFGWLDIKVFTNSTVSYTMDMVAQHKGYRNKLDVDIRGSEISSSVNHGLLWRSKGLSLDCDLSFPLGWNTLRTWQFNVICNDLELFILRDHLFLITDLVADWGSGPPPDYFVYIPFRYLLNAEFRNFRIYLNTNDSNIINNPADVSDNNFVVLFGRSLSGEVIIPLDRFRPLQNEIFFDVIGRDFGLELLTPPRNTVHTFLKNNIVAQLGEITLKGSHNYFSQTSISLTDTLSMDIHGSRLSLYAYGFLLKHFLKIKDNYFGDDLHFKTLEEFQGLPNRASVTESTDQPTKRSSDLDVILCLGADDVTVLLPANIYSAEDNIAIDLAFATADLRFTNYYMDMMLDSSPLSVSQGSMVIENGTPVNTSGRVELFVSAVNAYGHRVFGLPPTEPTYACNWDISAGDITGECSTILLDRLVSSLQGLAFGVDDDENALAIAQIPVIPDITFLRLKTGTVNVSVDVASEAFLLRSGPIKVDFNDWAREMFSQRVNVSVPELVVACIDAGPASRHRTRKNESKAIETYAYMRTALNVHVLGRKLHFSEELQKQQKHVWESDQRTHRTPFLLLPTSGSGLVSVQDPPAMPFPAIPFPLKYNTNSSASRSWTGSGSSRTSVRSTGRYTASIAHSLANSRSVDDFGPITGSRERPTAAEQGLRGATQFPTTKTIRQSVQREREVAQHGARSSVAFSSPLATPYFPLASFEPDASEAPHLPDNVDEFNTQEARALVELDGAHARSLDENLSHMSLLVDVKPGISVFVKPQAIFAAARIVEALQPKSAEDLLDAFQLDVIGKILEFQTRRDGIGKSLEFGFRIPAAKLRFINNFSAVHNGARSQDKDQYDLTMKNLALSLRDKKLPQPNKVKDSLSAHCTLETISIGVKEKNMHASHNDVATRAQIDDVLLWLAKGEQTSVHVSFRDFEAATASRRVDYLVSLVYRTGRLASDLQSKFSALTLEDKLRLRSLVYKLTTTGTNIPDPTFLTRPSLALRADTNHVRNHDSWKIISRCRYINQSLSSEQQSNIQKQLANHSLESPSDAQAKVLKSWDEWRTWDLAHVKKSLAMRKLYGKETDVDDSLEKTPEPFEFCLRAGSTRLLVDPGLNQSGLSMNILVLNLSTTPPSTPSGLMLVKDCPIKDLVVQANITDVALHVNWEISALVESILELSLQDNLSSEQKKDSAPTKAPVKPSLQNFHIVVATESGSISIETQNIKFKNDAKRLNVSLVGTLKEGMPHGSDLAFSTIVHATATKSEISSKSRMLIRSSARNPSLFISKSLIEDENIPKSSWSITGQTREIQVDIKEELPGLLEIADSIIMDEVIYFHRLAQRVPKKKKNPHILHPKAAIAPAQDAFPRFQIALFMDTYRINVALVHGLTYTLYGHTGRLSAIPTIGYGSIFKLDFDIAKQMHIMRSNSPGGMQDIATLTFPPVNGFVKVKRSLEGQTFVDLVTLVEVISLEGASMYSLAAALSKPEVFEALKVMQADLAVIKSHLQEIFPEPSSPVTPVTPTINLPMLYNVDGTLAGLKIIAATPNSGPNASAAELTVALKSLKLRASNVAEDNETVLPFPEINANLQEISTYLMLIMNGKKQECGNITLGLQAVGTMQDQDGGVSKREYRVISSALEVNLFAETASAAVDVLNHLQDRIKDLDLSKERQYFRRLRNKRRHPSLPSLVRKKSVTPSEGGKSTMSTGLFTSAFSFDLQNIQICWIVGNSVPASPVRGNEDLVLSFKRVDLSSKSEDGARLAIEDMQLQITSSTTNKVERSPNSALLPLIVFNVAYASSADSRQLAFQAAGKSLDVTFEPQFVIPADAVERSITLALKKFQTASASWQISTSESGLPKKNPFSSKKLASLVVDANFAGAVVKLQGTPKQGSKRDSITSPLSDRIPQEGRFGQFGDASTASTTLRSPGVSIKADYQDTGREPSLNIEVKVDGSSNTVYPSVVPLIMEISESVQEVVKAKDEQTPISPTKSITKKTEDDSLITVDPSAILGKTKLNVGLRICKQEFSLSCQPIARVAATAKFEDIYLTINSIRSQDHGHFFALSGVFEKLEVAVQHVYSRDSTFSFDVNAVKLSVLNSRHLSGTSGVSAILKIDPMRTQINARQLQDFLLFREIWIPPEIRQSNTAPAAPDLSASQEYLVQRYQQVTAAAAFPWNATIAIEQMSMELDLGQAIGKASLTISDLWMSSRKDSDWEQNLCIGIKSIAIDGSGRMSGFVNLNGFRVRTSITWPKDQERSRQTPLIQASIGFDDFQVKAAFDFQPFIIADIVSFEFIMYNVRESSSGRDRLVASLDGEKIQAYCIATSASRGLALFQVFERLVQENQAAYKQSLKDIEKYLRRQSASGILRTASQTKIPAVAKSEDDIIAPISLHTDVVVTLRSINLGAFPGTFLDAQVFTMEASDVQARFAVMLDDGKIHSGLGMTLGQLRVAVGSVPHPKTTDKPGEVTVEEVIACATSARGGTILRVPKVFATMQTWQKPVSNHIDYIFKSSFEGKVDVGWNYSRISFIRSMWDSHSRTLASRLGKPLPTSAVKITAEPSASGDPNTPSKEPREGEKITAVVNVPQSKYEYTALEPPIVDTPQLRDMGEATPPLEWIGLHRDRLPNVTHQIVIVMLLEVAKEVEDAYSRILGSS